MAKLTSEMTSQTVSGSVGSTLVLSGSSGGARYTMDINPIPGKAETRLEQRLKKARKSLRRQQLWNWQWKLYFQHGMPMRKRPDEPNCRVLSIADVHLSICPNYKSMDSHQTTLQLGWILASYNFWYWTQFSEQKWSVLWRWRFYWTCNCT